MFHSNVRSKGGREKLLTFIQLATFVLFLSISNVQCADAQVPFATIGFTKATLLSGGLSDCIPSPNVSSCTGGLASARAVFRSITNARGSLNTEFIYNFDKDTAFVQMHPLDYTVNIVTMREFGIRYYFANPSILPTYGDNGALGRTISPNTFYVDGVQMLQANVAVSSLNEWDGFVVRQVLIANDTIGLILIGSFNASRSVADVGSAVTAATRYLRSRVQVIVVVNLNDAVEDAEAHVTTQELLASLAGSPPDLFVDYSGTNATVVDTCASRPLGGSMTVYCSASSLQEDAVDLVHIHLNGSLNGLASAAVESVSTTGLSDPELDARYYADQAFLKAQALQAMFYDPALSSTYVGMPGTVEYLSLACYQASCPQGALFGNAALLSVSTADIAIASAASFRGNGWPSGNVKVSHVWSMLPNAATMSYFKVLGLKLWRLMNHSAYVYLGNSSIEDTSLYDGFLQGAGFQIDIDISKPRFTNRLLAVRVYNKASGSWEALVRTKYYGLAIDSFTLSHVPEIRALLQGSHYTGESSSVPFSQTLVQTLLGTYLSKHNPFYPQLESKDDAVQRVDPSLNNGEWYGVMFWVQTPLSCSMETERWDAGIETCVSCPSGQRTSTTNTSECEAIPSESKSSTAVVLAVAITVGLILGLAVIGLIAYFCFRGNGLRNIEKAPKTGDQITIVFTDIQSSTKLWGTVAESMAAALETHHRVIRECISSFGAYEVKTIGDSFMIACDSAERAVGMAVAIEERLAVQSWPACIGEVYACEGKPNEGHLLDDIQDTLSKTDTGPDLGQQRGLRVRIGASTGFAEAIFDDVSKGYEYIGPAVAEASRIETAAQGGQILISRTTANQLQGSDSYVVVHFLTAALKGFGTTKTELLQVVPGHLSHRQFHRRNVPLKALAGASGTAGDAFGDDLFGSSSAGTNRGGGGVGSGESSSQHHRGTAENATGLMTGNSTTVNGSDPLSNAGRNGARPALPLHPSHMDVSSNASFVSATAYRASVATATHRSVLGCDAFPELLALNGHQAVAGSRQEQYTLVTKGALTVTLQLLKPDERMSIIKAMCEAWRVKVPQLKRRSGASVVVAGVDSSNNNPTALHSGGALATRMGRRLSTLSSSKVGNGASLKDSPTLNQSGNKQSRSAYHEDSDEEEKRSMTHPSLPQRQQQPAYTTNAEQPPPFTHQRVNSINSGAESASEMVAHHPSFRSNNQQNNSQNNSLSSHTNARSPNNALHQSIRSSKQPSQQSLGVTNRNPIAGQFRGETMSAGAIPAPVIVQPTMTKDDSKRFEMEMAIMLLAAQIAPAVRHRAERRARQQQAAHLLIQTPADSSKSRESSLVTTLQSRKGVVSSEGRGKAVMNAGPQGVNNAHPSSVVFTPTRQKAAKYPSEVGNSVVPQPIAVPLIASAQEEQPRPNTRSPHLSGAEIALKGQQAEENVSLQEDGTSSRQSKSTQSAGVSGEARAEDQATLLTVTIPPHLTAATDAGPLSDPQLMSVGSRDQVMHNINNNNNHNIASTTVIFNKSTETAAHADSGTSHPEGDIPVAVADPTESPTTSPQPTTVSVPSSARLTFADASDNNRIYHATSAAPNPMAAPSGPFATGGHPVETHFSSEAEKFSSCSKVGGESIVDVGGNPLQAPSIFGPM